MLYGIAEKPTTDKKQEHRPICVDYKDKRDKKETTKRRSKDPNKDLQNGID